MECRALDLPYSGICPGPEDHTLLSSEELLKVLALRIYLAYQMKGVAGVGRSILYTLGWRSVWEKRS